MEFFELAKLRQSDRKYLDKPVEQEKIARCLETARLSPSACNAQPWRFVLVDDPILKNQVAECAASFGMNKFVAQAPVIVVIVLEKMNLAAKIGSVIQDKEYPLLDIGIAANQLCLQAADLGLGSCMVGWFEEKKVKKLLGIDAKKRIPLMITIGYADSPTRPKLRKRMEEICGKNAY